MLGERLILSEAVAEQTCVICKISESIFYRSSKGKKEIKNKTKKMKSKKLKKIKSYLMILIKQPFRE